MYSPNWSTSATIGSSPPSSPTHSRITSTTSVSLPAEPASPSWSTAATAGSSPPSSPPARRMSNLNLGQPLSPSAPTPFLPALTRQRKYLRGRGRRNSWREVFSASFAPSPAYLKYMAEVESHYAAWTAMVNDVKEAVRSAREEKEGKGIEKPAEAGERGQSVTKNEEDEDDVVRPGATDEAKTPEPGLGGENAEKGETGRSVRFVDTEVLGNEKGAVGKEENKLHARRDLSPSPRTSGTSRSQGLGRAEHSLGFENENFDPRRTIGPRLLENRVGVRRTRRIGVVEANRMCLHSYLRRC